ncbi:MAG: hypothetical protein R2715_22470 [Ilumatobacteraceae bacterium]
MPGDLSLCSDGLVDEVVDETIAELLTEVADPQQAAEELVATANRHGGRDNTTVVVVDVIDGVTVDDPLDLGLEPHWADGPEEAAEWGDDLRLDDTPPAATLPGGSTQVLPVTSPTVEGAGAGGQADAGGQCRGRADAGAQASGGGTGAGGTTDPTGPLSRSSIATLVAATDEQDATDGGAPDSPHPPAGKGRSATDPPPTGSRRAPPDARPGLAPLRRRRRHRRRGRRPRDRGGALPARATSSASRATRSSSAKGKPNPDPVVRRHGRTRHRHHFRDDLNGSGTSRSRTARPSTACGPHWRIPRRSGACGDERDGTGDHPPDVERQ